MSIALRFVAVLFVTLPTIALTGTPAQAHTRLVSSAPGDGASVDQMPAFLTLEFNEPIAPGFATVVAYDGPTSLGELKVTAGARISSSRVGSSWGA